MNIFSILSKKVGLVHFLCNGLGKRAYRISTFKAALFLNLATFFGSTLLVAPLTHAQIIGTIPLFTMGASAGAGAGAFGGVAGAAGVSGAAVTSLGIAAGAGTGTGLVGVGAGLAGVGAGAAGGAMTATAAAPLSLHRLSLKG